MSRAGDLVIALQAVLVLGALVGALTAYRKGLHDWAFFHLSVAGLAGMYLCGYAWLILSHIDRGTWSEIMVGVGFITWPVVWGWPSWASIRSQRKVERLRSTVVDYEQTSPILDRGEAE